MGGGRIRVAGFVAVALAVTAGACGLLPGPDPRISLCPIANGEVATVFAVERASDVRKAIPRMGTSPELDASDHPALVVIYAGEVTLPVFGGPSRVEDEGAAFTNTSEGVVCVVVDNQANVYTDVDTSELNVP